MCIYFNRYNNRRQELHEHNTAFQFTTGTYYHFVTEPPNHQVSRAAARKCFLHRDQQSKERRRFCERLTSKRHMPIRVIAFAQCCECVRALSRWRSLCYFLYAFAVGPCACVRLPRQLFELNRRGKSSFCMCGCVRVLV